MPLQRYPCELQQSGAGARCERASGFSLWPKYFGACSCLCRLISPGYTTPVFFLNLCLRVESAQNLKTLKQWLHLFPLLPPAHKLSPKPFFFFWTSAERIIKSEECWHCLDVSQWAERRHPKQQAPRGWANRRMWRLWVYMVYKSAGTGVTPEGYWLDHMEARQLANVGVWQNWKKKEIQLFLHQDALKRVDKSPPQAPKAKTHVNRTYSCSVFFLASQWIFIPF